MLIFVLLYNVKKMVQFINSLNFFFYVFLYKKLNVYLLNFTILMLVGYGEFQIDA